MKKVHNRQIRQNYQIVENRRKSTKIDENRRKSTEIRIKLQLGKIDGNKNVDITDKIYEINQVEKC